MNLNLMKKTVTTMKPTKKLMILNLVMMLGIPLEIRLQKHRRVNLGRKVLKKMRSLSNSLFLKVDILKSLLLSSKAMVRKKHLKLRRSQAKI